MENIISPEKLFHHHSGVDNIDNLTNNSDAFYDQVESILSKSKDEKTLSKLCTKLTNIYKEHEQQRFLIINQIPNLLKYYFKHYYDDKFLPIIEACLLTIYNLSLNDHNNAKINRIRVPNLSLPSVYHNPQTSATRSELTESALSKLESEYVIITEQYKPITSALNTEKRASIVRCLLNYYHSKICDMSKQSKFSYCDMCIKSCRPQNAHEPIHMYLNSLILIEMLKTLYYLYYNDFGTEAYRAIDIISQKAEDELMADVILMVNSIKNLALQGHKYDLNSANADSKITLTTTTTGSPTLTSKYESTSTSMHTSNSYNESGGPAIIENEQESDSLPQKTIADVVYISTSGEARNAVKRASLRMQSTKLISQQLLLEQEQNQQQQQQQTSLEQGPARAPLADSESIPNIDESNGESDEYADERL